MDRSPTDPAEVLGEVCSSIATGDLAAAAENLRRRYPFEPIAPATRSDTPLQSLQVFLRDGFCDRYTGHRLVNPAALRLVTALLPREFPAHRNWKQSESHIAYWELFPTIDHVVPIARGGADVEENRVTTSMFRNAAKGSALLSELGWQLHPPGDAASWDGLTRWVVGYLDTHPGLEGLQQEGAPHRAYIQRWARASKRALLVTGSP